MKTVVIAVAFSMIAAAFWHEREKMFDEIPTHITSVQDLERLVVRRATEIPGKVDRVIADAQSVLERILAVDDAQRTYANTAQLLDELAGTSPLEVLSSVLWLAKETSTDEQVRAAAQAGIKRIQEFYIDAISSNRQLYQAFKGYVENRSVQEQLDPEQRYFLKETMKSFERAGLDLPEDQFERARELKKEIADLSLNFSGNIAKDQSKITVTREGLAGLDEDFISQLTQTDDGGFVLGVDYPTYTHVMENSAVEDTRKRLYYAFTNRAYPVNKEILERLKVRRTELAQLLGYPDYATYDLEEQMVKSPERAISFLHDLLDRSQPKEAQERMKLVEKLPTSVTLASDGKIKPWDGAYLKNQYKKEHLEVDEHKIAEYFPMQQTIDGLLGIYEQFFNLRFEQVPAGRWWHEDVKLIAVFDRSDDALLGYLFLDLHPRPFKYSHACQVGLIQGTKHGKDRIPSVVAVLANFPKPTASKPSLLPRDDVRTFFHEFGHALHTLLGATQLASLSGTSVKRDFVEMPSQMLEEWLWDKEILKQVSGHYQTGEQLPDELITKILKTKQFDSGNFVQVQAIYALISLGIFDKAVNDFDEFVKTLYERYRPGYSFAPGTHMWAHFGHLTGYGAKYYGYLWSKVFALDLFEAIEKEGLLNPSVGARYVEKVIGRGGSQDPNELLRNFLGREPETDAFFKDMGIQTAKQL